MPAPADWIETKTDELLRRARRSGFFADVIRDARHFQADGYAWDVCLALSLEFWGLPTTPAAAREYYA